MFDKEILDLFNVAVVDYSPTFDINLSLASAKKGFITDFIPTKTQRQLFEGRFKPLNMTTLFTVHERENSSIDDLLTKQILHYIEIYGLNKPGAFNLEFGSGKVATLNYVRGVTVDVLATMICSLIYSNTPVKDAVAVGNIIKHYKIEYEFTSIKNNEVRCVLFDTTKHCFEDGDDAVRYICYKATGSAMLIKDKNTIAAVEAMEALHAQFFQSNSTVLANVFNRHKPLILACKSMYNRTAINAIGRASKKLHIPVHEPFSKRFIRVALADDIADWSVIDQFDVRDKFKFLNLLEYKKMRNSIDAFMIRNGRVHIENGRELYQRRKVDSVIDKVLGSLAKDLAHLHGKKIKLDYNVAYGLPISRKQTLGQLPYGTKINIEGDTISSGVYWENSWGARDLDLSAIDTQGGRTGWGGYNGYDKSNPIVFSGDMVDATNGAMEFLTSKNAYTETYGLFVNIYSGEIGAEAELVVGDKANGNWIENVQIRERIKLASKGTIFGFVRGGELTVYVGRMSNNMVSGPKEAAVIARGACDFWTVNRLFSTLGISYSVDNVLDTDYDLSYSGFSYDKLEELLLPT